MFDEMLSTSDIETRKRLAVIGAEEILSLQCNPDLVLVWGQIRNQIDRIFQKAGKSIRDIGDVFPRFYIDMWTEEAWAFDPIRDSGSLVICLWSLLFHSTFLLSSALVHEACHYGYLNRYNILGKPEPVQEEFGRKHRRQMEIEANRQQIEFLENVEEYFDEIVGYSNPQGERLLPERKREIIGEGRRVLEQWESGDFEKEYRKGLADTRKEFYMNGSQFLGMEHLIDKGIPRHRKGFKFQFWA